GGARSSRSPELCVLLVSRSPGRPSPLALLLPYKPLSNRGFGVRGRDLPGLERLVPHDFCKCPVGSWGFPGDLEKKGTIMQATATQIEARKLAEEYLGFDIQLLDRTFVAVPMGWEGQAIQAESMPKLRKKIW